MIYPFTPFVCESQRAAAVARELDAAMPCAIDAARAAPIRPGSEVRREKCAGRKLRKARCGKKLEAVSCRSVRLTLGGDLSREEADQPDRLRPMVASAVS